MFGEVGPSGGGGGGVGGAIVISHAASVMLHRGTGVGEGGVLCGVYLGGGGMLAVLTTQAGAMCNTCGGTGGSTVTLNALLLV